MFTYITLNCLFLVATYLLLRIPMHRVGRAWLYTFACLLGMTAVFDSLIIMANIVDYDSTKLLGIYLFKAPVEDFFYSLLAVSIIPVLWKRSAAYATRN